MINLYFDNGVAYVWNTDDWHELRSKHRIIGSLIGALPSYPRQNDFLGLPMALTSEEASLLLEKNIAELFELLNIKDKPTEEQKDESDALQRRLLEEQVHVLKKKRIEQLSQKIDIIIAGKRKKLKAKGLPEDDTLLNREVLLIEQIEKLPPIAPAHHLIHLPTEHQWLSDKKKVGVVNLVPNVLEGDGKIRYAVYRDLWEKGHYITNGLKFGADFLVYPGDPVRFHAMYMVRCMPTKSSVLRPSSVVAYGRLSVAVNKLAVFAYCDENNQIVYQTVQWHDTVNG